MSRALTVSIDAMGGDAGPGIVVAALLKAIQRHADVQFLLHGDEAQLAALLAKHTKLKNRVTIRHAPGRVAMEDKPSHVLRRGKDTSMWRAIDCVKQGEAQLAVSAGNTGALMAVAMFGLGIIEGISRPAIATIWPTMRGQTVVLDVGANVGATEEQLVDFAVMGEAFARVILGLEHPTVGILNVGSEEQKGSDAVKGAAAMLRGAKLPMAFHGFVEGDDIAKGTVDVVVTDGFTGNVALKTAEGTARLVGLYLRQSLTRSLFGRVGALIASSALKTLRRKLDPRASAGGIFLGLNGVVVKCHGGADAVSFASALDMALDMAKADINSRITADRRSISASQVPA
ncbi:MAG: fatty acid/phospholipid synthesis protein PlsX [Alphaproteobacteria bacterium]|nr:fatty acid/phospholipid synthesis protein PlsX [Alphaproteobacteria bacterium]